jgi:uncharacterized protein (DUF1778 family)
MNSNQSARLDIRTNPEIKREMEEAASHVGVPLSTFIVQTTVERARLINQQARTTKLDNQERDAFLSMLDNPPAPNDALIKLLAGH